MIDTVQYSGLLLYFVLVVSKLFLLNCNARAVTAIYYNLDNQGNTTNRDLILVNEKIIEVGDEL